MQLSLYLYEKMNIERFEDIIAWQKAQELVVEIYKILQKVRDYGFKDQIQRAALSISNNIAEGFDRDTDKELIRFFHIAKASASEVKSMLYVSEKLGYIESSKAKELIKKTDTINRMIYSFIKSIS